MIVLHVCFQVVTSVVSVVTVLTLKLLAFIVNSFNVSLQFVPVRQNFVTFFTGLSNVFIKDICQAVYNLNLIMTINLIY